MRFFSIDRIHTACLQNKLYVLLIEHKQSSTVGSPRLVAKNLQKANLHGRRLLCGLFAFSAHYALRLYYSSNVAPSRVNSFCSLNRLIEQFQLKLLFTQWKTN